MSHCKMQRLVRKLNRIEIFTEYIYYSIVRIAGEEIDNVTVHAQCASQCTEKCTRRTTAYK